MAGLAEHGHVVDHARTTAEGMWYASENEYEVLIVDRMLPDGDGQTLVGKLREKGNMTPVIFLTAMGSIEDRVSGLEAGGDDYLVKPFAFSELYARVCSLARRPPLQATQTRLVVADLEMDLVKRLVKRGGKPIELHATEFRLLEFLVRRAGQVVTRTMLLEGVWDFHFDPKTSVVETHISRLRGKIDREGESSIIRTIRGAGYSIDDI